jgi:hypothetical protein
MTTDTDDSHEGDYRDGGSDLEYRYCTTECRKETLHRPEPSTDVSVRWNCTVCGGPKHD